MFINRGETNQFNDFLFLKNYSVHWCFLKFALPYLVIIHAQESLDELCFCAKTIIFTSNKLGLSKHNIYLKYKPI